MLTSLDNFYLNQEEPTRGCLLALKDVVLSIDNNMSPEWKYGMPFFYFKGKMFCYFWKDKKTNEPYIGILKGKDIDHPALESGTRKLVRILRIDPNKDIDIVTIKQILTQAISLYSI